MSFLDQLKNFGKQRWDENQSNAQEFSQINEKQFGQVPQELTDEERKFQLSQVMNHAMGVSGGDYSTGVPYPKTNYIEKLKRGPESLHRKEIAKQAQINPEEFLRIAREQAQREWLLRLRNWAQGL